MAVGIRRYALAALKPKGLRLKLKKINFKKYGPNKFEPTKFYGIVFHSHPKFKGVEIYFGRRIYEIWTGYKK